MTRRFNWPKRGSLTAYVQRRALRWEAVMALLTLTYVAVTLAEDEGKAVGLSFVAAGLAIVFALEFGLRCLDAPSRLAYLRGHWMDLVTCLPAIGPLRLLRLLRLLGLLRLAHHVRVMAEVRAGAVGDAGDRSTAWVAWPAALLLVLGGAYGFWIAEHGTNTAIRTFGDAAYLAVITTTTVGYGDFRPVTPEGKVVAGLLVFLGLGLLSFVSAQITARWLGHRNDGADVASQLASLQREIVVSRALLTRVTEELAVLNKSLVRSKPVEVTKEAPAREPRI